MYKIVVTKITKEKKQVQNYERLYDSEVFNKLNGGDLKQYDYVLSEQEVVTESKVYEQMVENIDMVKVIGAVNS